MNAELELELECVESIKSDINQEQKEIIDFRDIIQETVLPKCNRYFILIRSYL